jgi:hypothetical protein
MCATDRKVAIANTGSDATRNGIQASETGAMRKRLQSDPITGVAANLQETFS